MFLRTALIGLLFFFCRASPAFPQDTLGGDIGSVGTTSLFLARIGERLDSPHVGTRHYLEFLQIRNRWIYPDIGYIDFAHGNYRELFIGGGRTLIRNQRISWDQVLLYDQAMGMAARSARYLQPLTMLRVRITPRFTNDTEYFLYIPINDSARVQHVLERSKFEYALKRRWMIGAGYAGVKFADLPWQNKPLVTTTFLTSAGEFEFWLQRVPGGAQIQFRYELIHTSR